MRDEKRWQDEDAAVRRASKYHEKGEEQAAARREQFKREQRRINAQKREEMRAHVRPDKRLKSVDDTIKVSYFYT